MLSFGDYFCSLIEHGVMMSMKYRQEDFTCSKKAKQSQDILEEIVCMYEHIQVRNIKLLIPHRLHKLYSISCKEEGLQTLIPGVTLSHQWPFFQAMDLWALHFLRRCPVLSSAAPCPSLGALPCSALSWGWGSQVPPIPLSPRVPNPLCTSPSPCFKTPSQTKQCPFSPLPENVSYPQCVHIHPYATLKQNLSEHC